MDRTRLEEALALISTQRGRIGDATIDTAVTVLEEKLAGLPPPAERAPETTSTPLQRKQVTILFAALDGFTRLVGSARNTERLRQIDLLWRRFDESILAHGGVVDKHMGDVIMGIFGAEVAREDDPERAVRCALALREMAADYLGSAERGKTGVTAAPVIRIGINTGQVILGQVGSDAGRTAIGDAVNVASRLKEAADGAGIYISQETYRLVRERFRVEALGEVIVKGRRGPVAVFRVLGSRPRVFYPGREPGRDDVGELRSPMIGRDEEMSSLKGALSDVLTRQRGRLVLIVGDTGVGKSRLAAEFYRWLESSGHAMTIFQARCDQWMARTPYGLLRELLVTHFNIDESDRRTTIEGKIAHQLSATLFDGRPADNSEIADRVRAIIRLVGMGLPAEMEPGPDSAAGAADREQSIALLLDYLEATARSQLTLFLIEDIHWIDDDSLNLLERVCVSAADKPLLMLGMARHSFFERRPDWLDRVNIPTTRILLQPLNELRCREMVLSILRDLPRIPAELTQLIVESSAGNPFFAEELIQVLIEDGVIVPHEKGWMLRPYELHRLRVPATLTGVLQARLDRLPEVERVTLQQAAVIGDEFWTGAVQAVNAASRYPHTAEQVEAALQSLERRDIVYRTSAPMFAGHQAYRFSHAVLREVAYESVLLRNRPGYHLEAAQWLEEQSDERLADYAALIAPHHEMGGRAPAAARLYEVAAARALDQFKVSGAIQYFRKVLDLLGDRPQHIDTRLATMERLGHALQRRGRLVEALDTYRTMHDTAELDGNILGRARALNAQAAVLCELGRYEPALESAGDAERLARLTDGELELVRSLLHQAEVASRLGRTHEALAAATAAVERGRSLDAPLETARGLALMARLPSAVAQPQTEQAAMAELDALVESLVNSDQDRDAAGVLHQMGDLLLAQGRPAGAAETFRRALERARAAGELGLAARVLRQMGLATCRAGNAADAINQLEEAAGLAEVTDDRYLRLGCRLAMGEALAAQGHSAAAEATLRQVIATAEDPQRMGNWEELPRAYRLLAGLEK